MPGVEPLDGGTRAARKTESLSPLLKGKSDRPRRPELPKVRTDATGLASPGEAARAGVSAAQHVGQSRPP